MTVVVSFIKAQSDEAAAAIGVCRVRENITPPGTTVATTQPDEMVVIGNAETTMVAAAFGSTPDAAATAATSQTSAGIPIPSGGLSYALAPPTGSKINIKAVT